MIFVTVGASEEPFDRLIKKIDELKYNGQISETIFLQIGNCKNKPRYCQYRKRLDYKSWVDMIKKARIVISHGGPGCVMHVIFSGKVPIVVPRKRTFVEAPDDHQIEYTQRMEQEGKIIAVYDIEELQKKIHDYDTVCIRLGIQSYDDSNVSYYIAELHEICHGLQNKLSNSE